MFLCDRCPRAFHSDCIGAKPDDTDEAWYCFLCQGKTAGAAAGGNANLKAAGEGARAVAMTLEDEMEDEDEFMH